MANLGNLEFQVHLQDMTDAEADKIKKKLENLSVSLKIDGKSTVVSNTDAIKKQIEDAVKSVTVSSVNVDTKNLVSQIQNATQNISSSVKVTLQKGALSSDLQAYLDAKTFNVNISISRSSASSAVSTAFANLSVPVNVSVSASAVIQQLSQSLANRKVKINVEAKSSRDLIDDIEKKLKGKKIKVDVEADKNTIIQSVKNALQGNLIKATVDVKVDAQAITRAVQSAINNASFTYQPNGGRARNVNSASNAQRNLGNSYYYAAKGAQESTRASVSLGKTLSTNIRIAGELGSTLGNIASVFKIKEVLDGVVRIGGQLENQRIALGSILQDAGKASAMFSKIQNLAVKSPFGIMDLNQYTKQLSAYGIEYNELYDTMKRMADISAGVGVDMGRIILAFGQVKAAGFLKGTELRQFTEANIPMVQALADKFSILEKRIVSAGEVYDMISEKKVTFEDVKDVLWKLTDEGGMFNNMQEVLSESLASKWKNLADAVDVMYGKMADGTAGSGLKLLAEGLTELTKKWEYLTAAIGTAGAAYLTYKAKVSLGNKHLNSTDSLYNSLLASKRKEANNLRLIETYRKLTAVEQRVIATTDRLTASDVKRLVASKAINKEQAMLLIHMKKVDTATAAYLARMFKFDLANIKAQGTISGLNRALISLGNTMRNVWAGMKSVLASGWTWFTAALTVGFEAWAHYEKKQGEIEQRNKEVLDSAKGSISSIKEELKKLESVDVSKLNDEQIKIKVNELTTIIKNETSGWQSLLSEVFAKDADGNFVNSATKQLSLLEEKLKAILKAKNILLDNPEMFSNIIDATDGFIFNKSVVENAQKYTNAVSEAQKVSIGLAPYIEKINTAINRTSNADANLKKQLEGKELYEQISIIRDNERAWATFSRTLNALGTNSDIQGLFLKLNGALDQTKTTLNSLESDTKEGITALKNIMTIKGVKDFDNLTDEWRLVVIEWANKFVDEAGVQAPKMRQALMNMWLEAFNIKNDLGYMLPELVVTPEKYDASKDEVAKLWKKRAEEIKKAVDLYDKWKEVEGADNARNRVAAKKELANLFNGKYGFNLDLEKPEDAYRTIMSKLDASKSAQHELLVSLGVKLDEATLDDVKQRLKDYLEKSKQYIDKTTAQWDLYKDLFKATGNRSLSENIAFGKNVSFKNQVEQLKADIEREIKSSGVKIGFDELIGMNNEELTQKGYAKFKNLVEAYNRENKKLSEESIKNFINVLSRSKDFAQQITDIENQLQKDLSDLRANAGKMSKDELSRREAELVAKAEEDKVKVNFEEFKKSSDWVKVFDDLDRVSNDTLDAMISKVEEFAKQASISEEVTKQLVDAMAKLRDEAIERNPFKGFADAWERLRNLKSGTLTESGMVRFGKGTEDDPYTFKKNEDVQNEIAEANDDLKESALAVADKFQAVADAADMLSGLFQGLGIDVSGFVNVVSGTVSGAKTGAGIASTLGIAGPWGAMAGAAVGMLSSVFAAHDNALQAEIEASKSREKMIKSIADLLEKQFERNLGGVYTMELSDETKEMLQGITKEKSILFSTYRRDTKETAKEALNEDSYYLAQLAALKAQRDEVYKQKRAEEDKKDSDSGKVADYENELRQMADEIRNFSREMMDALYGIDFKDWASQLSTTIVDAWANGEDAAEAYKNKVGEIMRDVVTSMVQQAIIGTYLEQGLSEVLEMFEANGGVMNEDLFGALGDLVGGLEDKIEQSEEFLDAYEKVLNEKGLSMKELGESEDSLSKGIKGVTEDTANLLASYLNAIRQDVSVKRTLIEQLVSVDVPKINYIAEAQLRELNQIASNTLRNADAADKIYDLVNRVVDKGSNKLKI